MHRFSMQLAGFITRQPTPDSLLCVTRHDKRYAVSSSTRCVSSPPLMLHPEFKNISILRTCLMRMLLGSVLIALNTACSTLPTDTSELRDINPADLLTVDCLLPSQVRQLGTHISYLAPRRAIRTSGARCALRGGEYVAHDRADFRTALSVWLPQAEKGDPEAQTYVGEIYEKGLGTPASYELAASWYQRAVNQNYSRAMINLGYLYESGMGVTRDLTRAINLYRQASGFTAAELEYVSAIEVANRKASQVQTEQLREDVKLLQERVNEYRRNLDVQKRELSEKENQIVALNSSLARQDSTASTDTDYLSNLTTKHQQDKLSLQKELDDVIEKKNTLNSKLQHQYETTAALRQQRALTIKTISQLKQDLAMQIHNERTLKLRLKSNKDTSEARNRELQDARTHINTLKQQIESLESSQAARADEIELTINAASVTEKSLTHQIGEQQQLIESLEEKLATEHKSHQISLELLESKLVSSKNQQNQQRKQFTVKSASDKRKLEQLQAELDTQRADYIQQTLALESLQLSLSGKQVGLSPAASDQITNTQPVGLSINIIDPPVLITRGSKAMRFGGNSAANIIGQINPANRLFAFRINGREHPVNEAGLFTFDTSKNNAHTLDLLAVDRQGASTRLAIDLPESGPQATIDSYDESALKPSASASNQMASTPLPVHDIDFGDYYALIIGNDSYDSMSDLQTAGNDAIAVEQILREKYGFETVLLLNANHKTMLSAIERMRVSLGPQDNLVIYYAGNGELDEQSGRGYWLPTDASATNKSKWVSNTSITAMIDTMTAKHVLVIADSCYSGTLSRSSVARPLPETSADLKREWLKAIAQSRVRTVLSSGGVKPVLSGSPGSRHSVFAAHFLESLAKNNSVLETYELFFQLQQKVANTGASLDTQQIPQYAPIRHAGHQAGEFVFVPTGVTNN